jgi:hypothetical protein
VRGRGRARDQGREKKRRKRRGKEKREKKIGKRKEKIGKRKEGKRKRFRKFGEILGNLEGRGKRILRDFPGFSQIPALIPERR